MYATLPRCGNGSCNCSPFWLGANPFLVIIAAGTTGIFLFKNLAMETDEKETGNMFHVKHVQIFLSP